MTATDDDLQLRPASPDDVDELAELYVATRREAVPAMPPLPDPAVVPDHLGRDVRDKEVWVAETVEGLAGFLTLTPTWLDDLYVGPRQQGRGIGTALLDLAKAQRPEGFALWVFASNRRARGFYHHHGLLELEHTDGADNAEHAPDVRMAWPGTDPVGYLRRLIDDVDSHLASLLERRLALTTAVQARKPVGGEAGRDPRREREIVERMAHLAPSFGPDRLERIVHTIISESLAAAQE